ncbi:fluoride efflux transporter CrcB [Microbispora sp. H11081]|uniref:fluoride efflux transporter CrcB n=1 Tax=Microbispora sp. H11081 TaxID=2729107 RepID=UPI001473A71F|nr:fluoride efflux transporter CrcB [Microbispora sp. H11081]
MRSLLRPSREPATGRETGRGEDEEDGVGRRVHGDREEADLPVDPDADLRHERDVIRPPAAPARHRTWDVLAMIALGGGIGSVARHLVGLAFPAPPTGFPMGTFLINVTGCFALGALMVFVLDVWPPRRYVRPFLGVGVLGGYTTFSTFAAEIVDRSSHGALPMAALYAVASLVTGLAAVLCGIVLARALAGIPVRRHGRGNA